jgi:hypothetical protein
VEHKLNAKGSESDARNHYVTVRRLQEPQLHIDEEQEEEPGPAGVEEVLPGVPPPHGA